LLEPVAQTGAEPAASRESPPLCAICQSPFSPGEATVACPDCHTEYHADCWNENRGCALYGCSQVPPTEGRRAIEVPVAYWGRENKACPVCDKEILAAAVRCRHCGTVFQTARPVESGEYSRMASLKVQSPRLRKTIIWLFVLNIIPFSAPVAALAGWFWRQSHRDAIDLLPSLYPAMLTISLIAGLFQTAAIVLLTVFFVLLR
jgi:predicted amidophosphoribosyltransferase